MWKIFLTLAYFACTSQGWRQQFSVEELQGNPQKKGRKASMPAKNMPPLHAYDVSDNIARKSLKALMMSSKVSDLAAAFTASLMGGRFPASDPTVTTPHPAILDSYCGMKMTSKQLKHNILASAVAVALAFSPSPVFADILGAADVDKTGIVGGVASFFETGIDLGSNALGSYGASIIAFTLIVRLVQVPLQISTLESQEKYKKFKPLQDKLDKAFPEPLSEKQEEKKYKVQEDLMKATDTNLAAGFIAPIVQISVLLSFVRSLKNLIAESKLQEPFLWIPSLEGPIYRLPQDKALDWFKSIFSGNPSLGLDNTLAFLSLPVIYGVVQTISLKLLPPPDSEANFQKRLNQVLNDYFPLITTFFSLQVPAGLNIYWIVSNIIGTITSLYGRQVVNVQPLSPAATKIEAALDRRIERLRAAAPVAEDPKQRRAKRAASDGNVGYVKTGEMSSAEKSTESSLRWKQLVTDGNQRYYWDMATGKTQWEPPTQGWVELLGDAGTPFYWEPEKNITQWAKP